MAPHAQVVADSRRSGRWSGVGAHASAKNTRAREARAWRTRPRPAGRAASSCRPGWMVRAFAAHRPAGALGTTAASSAIAIQTGVVQPQMKLGEGAGEALVAGQAGHLHVEPERDPLQRQEQRRRGPAGRRAGMSAVSQRTVGEVPAQHDVTCANGILQRRLLARKLAQHEAGRDRRLEHRLARGAVIRGQPAPAPGGCVGVDGVLTVVTRRQAPVGC